MEVLLYIINRVLIVRTYLYLLKIHVYNSNTSNLSFSSRGNDQITSFSIDFVDLD